MIARLLKAVSSCLVKSEGVKIVVKRLEEPGFPARHLPALSVSVYLPGFVKELTGPLFVYWS